MFDFIENSSETEFDFGLPSQPSSKRPPKYDARPSRDKTRVTRPTFGTDWSLNIPPSKKRRVSTKVKTVDLDADDNVEPQAALFNETLGLDQDGKPVKGALQLADRSRRRFV